MRSYYYMGHTIRRTKCTTNGSRMVFGRPSPAIVDIYIIDGPVVTAGITARLTSLSACRERIRAVLQFFPDIRREAGIRKENKS
jgi:hypothetical protein